MDGRVDASPRNRQDWSDAALLAAIASRDGAAFAAFYRRHVPMVLAYLLGETRDREVTADLAAEVFASIMLSAGRYAEQHESATPWLIAIARNKLLMSLRHGRVEAQARRRLGFEAVALDDDDLDRLERIAAVGGGQLVELLETLPQNERVAVRSRVLDERSDGEIAVELSCSEMVVRKRVSRGLARMRDQLKSSNPPARPA
jgi:RNA polymerase sigma-70 factor, ECF subfamily